MLSSVARLPRRRVPQAASSSGAKTLYIIGGYETKGESSQAVPNYDDGAKLAVQDLMKKGWTVKYERIPASGTVASSQEQAFLAAQAKNPDFWIGLTSSNVFIPVGPKVAATDVPTFALAAPTEGVSTRPVGRRQHLLAPSAQRADLREVPSTPAAR